MTDKFPSLTDVKQRVFGLDLARFTVEQEERAAVVTAERGRITLFWSRLDGSWGSLRREHDNLNLTPRRPERSGDFGWTPRIGIGAAERQVVLVYKRRFADSSARDLWLDLFDFGSAADRFGQTAAPRRFPREALGIDRFGWGIWADAADGRLNVVAQVLPDDGFPRLALLQTAFPVDDPASLEDPDAWTSVGLDRGGWDFDARRDGERLVVLHRRDAPTYSTDLFLPNDPGFGGPIGVLDFRLSENPTVASRTLTEMAVSTRVLVEADLASSTVTTMDETLPFGESPQIHSVDPFIASINRLEDARVVIRPGGSVNLRRFRSSRHLLMRTRVGWRTTRLLTDETRWPHHLGAFARAQLGLSLQIAPAGAAFRLTWGSLWTQRPIVLFGRAEAAKGTLLTFGHQDSNLGALRATTFQVFEDDGGETLRALPESFALLDIGHRHISKPGTREREPIEYAQLRPLEIESTGTHANGLVVTRIEGGSGNTMVGTLAAPNEKPTAFYAYTDMSDGGARVIFEGGLELPPPTATADEKTFKVGWVAEPEPPIPGRAWVRLENPVVDTPAGPVGAMIDTDLTGYFNPVSRINSGSVVFEQQPSLDGLAFAVGQLRNEEPIPGDPRMFDVTPGGEVRYSEPPDGASPDSIEFIALGVNTAEAVQNFVLDPPLPAPPPRPARSASDQPFAILIQALQITPFANETLAFDGFVEGDVDQDEFQFDWAFSDGTTDTGRHVEHNFGATQPDFSSTTPGQDDDDITVTLTVTATDGQTSTATTSFPLPASLWATLWTAYGSFRRAPDNILDDQGDWQVSDEEWKTFFTPGMFVRDVTLSFYRYSLRFIVDAQGRGTRVEVSNKPVHDGRFLFLRNDQGQGDVAYEVPIRARLTNVRLTGDFGGGLGNLVQIASVDVRMTFTQRFTMGVQTSEQRERGAESETILDKELESLFPPAIAQTMTPSALCCLPVEQPDLDVKSVDVESSLTAAGFVLTVLLPVLIAVVGMGALLVIIALLAPAALPALIAGSLSAVVVIIAAAGLGLTLALAIHALILRGFIADAIRQELEKPETLTNLREAGLFTYAGEGLCEALTQHLIRQAQADGHEVLDAGKAGRDRYRSPFFETIVVGANECKAQLRV